MAKPEEPTRTGAPDAPPPLVRMMRPANGKKPDHYADVHPAEVNNYARGGFRPVPQKEPVK